jgi:ADP-heptose:LPS heptosyltransferase
MAARSPLVQWAKRHGLISEAYSLDRLGIHRFYGPAGTFSKESAASITAFDAVVSFLGGPREPPAVRLSKTKGLCLLAVDPKPTASTLQTGRHITQQWADALAGYGCSVSFEGETSVNLPPTVQADLCERLAARLGAATGPIVLCHPGSGSLKKCCPIEALERLVRGLLSAGWCAGWMVGPDELERFGKGYVERLEASAPVLFEESVEAAADLVCGARVYIGYDAGMTHVAALGGVCTFAIFGPTDPRVWRPLGNDCHIVRFPVDGEDCEWTDTLSARIGRP